MRKLNFITISLLLILLTFCNKETEKLNYPKTNKIPIKDNYFGTEVVDNYRWLEDDNSEETKKWVTNQNEITFSYLDNIPLRGQLKNRLEQLWNYEKETSPFKEGDYIYYYKNNGLQNQYVLYRKKKDTDEELFLDPNTFAKDGTTSLSGLSFSENGNFLAYSISEGGSDWRKVIVLNAINKKIIEDTLVDIKFSGIQWKSEEGFYYSSYDKPVGSELSEITDQHKLYYHKLGTSQSDDKLVYGGTPEEKHRYVGARVTEDGKYLFITASRTTSGNISFLKDISVSNSSIVNVDSDYTTDSYLLGSKEDKLFIVTNSNAPNQKVVSVNAKYPNEKNWKDFIPETENVLYPSTGGGYFFARYIVDVITKVIQYDH